MHRLYYKTAALAAVICLGMGSAAQAGQLYDQSLGGAGFYNGTGNPDGGFTTWSGNGVTIGMRAKGRQSGSVIDTPNNTYAVPAGSQAGVPTRAWWNYEFSVACSGVGQCPGNTNIQGLFTNSVMRVKDLTTGLSGTVSMLHWLDDATLGAGGKSTLADPTSYAAQNSENMTFADNPLGFFDMFANDFYNFKIDLYGGPNQTSFLGSDNINVAVGGAKDPTKVPEPLTMATFGAGLAGAAALRRRKKKLA